MVLDSVNPALLMPPLWATILSSVVITILMTLAYKWMTDQKKMKEMKDEMKKYNDQMKLNKKDPARVMELQKKAMQVNMKYFTSSMKPTLITFIPLLLVFGWLNASLSFAPIYPGQEFSTNITLNEGVTGQAEIVTYEGLQIVGNAVRDIDSNKIGWQLKGTEGEHLIEYKINNQSCSDCKTSVLITDQQKYATVKKTIRNDEIRTIELGNKPLKVIWKLSWLWVYIIVSIVLSMSLRKVMKIY